MGGIKFKRVFVARIYSSFYSFVTVSTCCRFASFAVSTLRKSFDISFISIVCSNSFSFFLFRRFCLSFVLIFFLLSDKHKLVFTSFAAKQNVQMEFCCEKKCLTSPRSVVDGKLFCGCYCWCKCACETKMAKKSTDDQRKDDTRSDAQFRSCHPVDFGNGTFDGLRCYCGRWVKFQSSDPRERMCYSKCNHWFCSDCFVMNNRCFYCNQRM